MDIKEKIRSTRSIKIRNKKDLRYIAQIRKKLIYLPKFWIKSYGPSTPNDKRKKAKELLITGSQQKKASTKISQGIWLTKMAKVMSIEKDGETYVIELGTAAGISCMYILLGLSEGGGGHVTTFEGSKKLAKLAEKSITRLIEKFDLKNVTFELIIGNFDEKLEPFVKKMDHTINIAFIDGNHREEATVNYHKIIRSVIEKDGIIVHDDISWSNEMKRAWNTIQQMEGAERTVELYLGNQPSRGIIFLSTEAKRLQQKKIHLDCFLERIGRIALLKLKSA